MAIKIRNPFYNDTATKASALTESPAIETRSIVSGLIPQNPTPQDVPSTWQRVVMGPGSPVTPWGYSFNGLSDRERELAELEPRTSQYLPNQNANIMPRIGAGLMPFSQLNWFNMNVPEPALFRRLRIAGLKDFIPQILGPDGEVIQKARTVTWRGADGLLHKTHTGDNELQIAPDLAWLTTCPQPTMKRAVGKVTKYIYTEETHLGKQTIVADNPPERSSATQLEEVQWTVARPDRYNAFPTWLSRFMFNAIVYDAACFYKIRDESGRIVGMRVIDGSTIFLIIDERGETPAPPAPAFSQIIWGTPRNWFNTAQLWYRPQNLRAEAPPYGITPAEDGWANLMFLNEFWQWWISEYTQGTMPRAWLKPAAGTPPEKAAEYERMLDARQAHNYQMRARAHALLPGWDVVEAGKREFRGEEYNTARDQLALIYGVHPTELGRAPQGTGLTGTKGASEKGEEAHARIGLNPDVAFIESAFNDVLLEMAEDDDRLQGCTWQLSPGDTTIDPMKEEAKWNERWSIGGITLNEYRNAMHLMNDDSDLGDQYNPAAWKANAAPAAAGPNGQPPKIEPQAPPEEDAERIDQTVGKADKGYTTIMIALEVPQDTALWLRLKPEQLPKGSEPTPSDEFHLTLAFLGEASEAKYTRRDLEILLTLFGNLHNPISGTITGFIRFDDPGGDGKDVYCTSFDSPDLPKFRQDLIDTLATVGIAPASEHGFTPHFTLAYVPKNAPAVDVSIPPTPITFDRLLLAWNDEHFYIPLKTYSNANIDDIAQFEKAWSVEPLLKHCGVCEEDDVYFGAPLSRETEVLFPQQGANETEIVAMTPAGREPRPALWKPEGGEKEELSEAIGGPQYVREEAAYLLDRMLDLRLIPVAYVSEIEGERGAAIMYVRGNEPRENVATYDDAYVEGAAVLDYVMNQADRLTHNWLTHPQEEDRPILIDNGLTFPTTPVVIGSVFVTSKRGQPLSSGLLARLKRSLGRLEWRDIEVMIGPEATEQAKARAQLLLEKGGIPE